VIDIETIRDRVGQLGYFEERAARLGLIRRSRIVAQRYPTSRLAILLNRNEENIKVKDVFNLVIEGDPAAKVVFDETVDLLAIVISNLFVLLDPEVIVLGGPSDWNWGIIVDAIRDRTGYSSFRPVQITTSNLGVDAVIIGGAAISISIDGVLPI
jgi:predicted NBD/HSP70 family sugar kinase